MVINETGRTEEARRRLRAWFGGRRLAVATMHRKEAVIGPALAGALGVLPEAPAGLDTDRFGAFSGEVERPWSPLETARRKAAAAMELSGCTLAVASEGSFGPHPQLFFAAADAELVLLTDRERGLEVVGQAVSTRTNFAHEEVADWEALCAFAARAGFPGHGLILKDRPEGVPAWVIKGITDWAALEAAARAGWRRYGRLAVETDMRALYNPTRMTVIAEAVNHLLDKLHALCPACAWPGFGVTERQGGLRCGECGLPTRQVRSWLYTCDHCGHRREVEFPEGRREADPAFCDFCNP